MKVVVALSLNIFEKFTYEFTGKPEDIFIGIRVIVPVGHIIRSGWIISLESDYTGRTRKIIGIIKSNWKPTKSTLDFIRNISELYLMSEGTLLDYCLLPGHKSLKDIYLDFEGKLKSISKFSLKEILDLSKLTPVCFEYKKEPALQQVNFSNKDLFNKHYIYGKARFDKYNNIINKTLENGKSVLIVIPDKLSIEYFKKTFPKIDIYNSTQKKSVKEMIWAKYSTGKSGIIIGGLSALFLQINNLGCIISEKGNTLYTNKGILSGSEDFKILSIKKAAAFNCPIFIGTPSIELKNFKDNKEIITENSKPISNVNVMRIKKKSNDLFSDLIQLTKNYFASQKKILIILNKKQSKNILYCEKCKKAIRCQNCNKYIQTKKKNIEKCPHCEHKLDMICKICGKNLDILIDVSMDSILKVLKDNVTESGILNISAEDTKNISLLEDNIQTNKIIISTPFIIGPYFKNIFDSVIYYKPESVFDMDSYKTAENIFTLLSEIKNILKPEGTIDVFSVYHYHYVFKLINEENEFLNRELKYRQWFFLPPFYSIYEITVKEKTIRELGKVMRDIYTNYKNELNISTVSLLSRKKLRGTFKGILRVHTVSSKLTETGMLKKRNILIKLIYPS